MLRPSNKVTVCIMIFKQYLGTESRKQCFYPAERFLLFLITFQNIDFKKTNKMKLIIYKIQHKTSPTLNLDSG